MSNSTRTWTPHQSAIFTQIEQHDCGSLLVEAVAGSGKTTTGVEAMNRSVLRPAIALAFNKRNADDLGAKMPGTTASTFNGLGHRAWGSYLKRRLQLNADKTFELLREMKIEDQEVFFEVKRMVDICKNFGIVPRGAPGSFISFREDEQDTYESIGEAYDIAATPEIIARTREALLLSIKQSFNGVIDFNDQLYMTSCYRAPIERHAFAFIDEAQDLNSVQHYMASKAASNALIVGDPHQAIYGFRGALHDSFALLGELFDASHFPLTVSFRCPKEVVNEARRYVSHITPHDSAPDGEVHTLNQWSPTDISQGAMVLCRFNAPLFKNALALLRARRPVTILGGEIKASLAKIVQKISGKSVISSREFQAKLEAWADLEIAKRPKAEKKILDQALTLKVLATDSQDSTGILATLDILFRDAHNATVFSTIHKAKGMEAKSVYIIDTGIPDGGSEEQRQQEINLRYVAITRAQQKLTYLEARS